MPPAPPEAVRVAARIRDDVLDGVRPPGSRLVERDLADELGVSRVPVREALKILHGEGLVTLRPRTWAVVRRFTPDDIADLTEVREAIEVLAFRLAAQRSTADSLARLRAALAAEQGAVSRGDVVAARRGAADFHEAVIAASGNGLLAEIEQLMRSRMRWLLGRHDDVAEVAAQHARLLDAIERREVDGIAALAEEHLRSGRRLGLEHEAARGE